MRAVTRTPIIPLTYDQQARAVEREILIDYDRGEIWVVSPTDKSKLINITAKIKQAVTNYIDSYAGSQITDITHTYVIIKGVGRINTAEFLEFLAKNTIHGFPANDKGPMALTRLVYDNESILALKNKVVVAGFPDAGENYVPTKKNGTIVWVPISNLPTPEGYTPNKYDVSNIEPINNILQLTENPIQKSLDLEGIISLRLPTPSDVNYCHIKLILSLANAENTAILFDSRIVWRYSTDSDLNKGITYIYEFETYDSGVTWYSKKHSFNNNIDGESIITKEELNANYFTKQEVLDLISWQAMDEETLNGDDDFGDEGSSTEFIKGSALLNIQYYLDDLTYNPTPDISGGSLNLVGISNSLQTLNNDVTANRLSISELQSDVEDIDIQVVKNTEDIEAINIKISTNVSEEVLDDMFEEPEEETESEDQTTT